MRGTNVIIIYSSVSPTASRKWMSGVPRDGKT